MDKVELLAPAGSLDKLKMAIKYGADAVYIGGEAFSLRAAAENFTDERIREGIKFAHKKGKRIYVAVNIIPKNDDLDIIYQYAKKLYDMEADAVIVSDLGAFHVIREAAPGLPVHISTQANNVNYKSCEVWHKMGASRIVLARELHINEIKEIRDKLPSECELEAFVHGAMCVSYSGRCLLSNYLTNRDSNRGECAQPCRWKYYLMEEMRPNQYMPVFENENGTFIFNSKDLCMIAHIPELIESGIKSLKIEGRVKSEYYVATVVKAYREAIDSYYENGAGYRFDKRWLDEINKVSHREYSEGFYFGNPEQIYTYGSYVRDYDIIGMVLSYDSDSGMATIEQRNRFYKGDSIEFLPPAGKFYSQIVEYMENSGGEEIQVAPHPQMILRMKVSRPVRPDTIVRKAVGGAKDEQSIS
jgi:putative protease